MDKIRDVRIYTYENGQLVKWANGRKVHRRTSMVDAVEYIGKLRWSSSRYNELYKRMQFVLVEYTGKGESQIVSVL